MLQPGIRALTQRGSALVCALFIMTLVAMATVAISVNLQITIERTRLTLLSDKIYLASQVVPLWALSELTYNPRYNNPYPAAEISTYPSALQHLVPSMVIQGSLYDLQSRFNLNNLIDKKNDVFFLHLLALTCNHLTVAQRKQLLVDIKQWLTPYQPGHGQDNWLSYYSEQKPPFYPAQQLLTSVSELRLIRGVDAKTYQALEPFVTALPETLPININTAPRILLTALGPGLDAQQVKRIIQARKEKNSQSQSTLTALLTELSLKSDEVTLLSQYFLSIATVSSQDLKLTRWSIFKRSINNNRVHVTLESESVNTL